MGKTVFVAIFTIAVLLAGTISYGISSYTLPMAAADDDDVIIVDADCVIDCYDVFLDDVDMCGLDFEGNSDLNQLKKCMKQANKDFKKCLKKGNLAEDIPVCITRIGDNGD